MNTESKVSAGHLKRMAYLYIRQSTLRQVIENTESTQRQYALRQRAVALGWPPERIEVIDNDQGQSGASISEREGFQKLVADVGLGKAGIVMGLEVSRLARNCADWHRLLEICALSGTLILDEDGLYDPGHFNDRLLLGLKGTMSEAELHVLRARLRGGILSKARRGELKMRLPVGLVYDPLDRVVLDPDKQIQQSLRHFFETFRRSGSALAAVKAFNQEKLMFPRRARGGDVVWGALRHGTALNVIRNPRLAGAFCFGRHRCRRNVGGGWTNTCRPQEEWPVLIKDVHPGYIGWEEFEENQRRLRENFSARDSERRSGPAREGPALLQGIVLCGKCGRVMTLRYHLRRGQLVPDYICQKLLVEEGGDICQHIPGQAIDQAVSQLILESISPLALEVALGVQQELQKRSDETDHLRRQNIERAQYEADQARIRYMRVDPNNRLVADTLEALWNDKLRQLEQARETYEKQRQSEAPLITEKQMAQITALAENFPRLWSDPATSDRDRKRMGRLVLEDVTLNRDQGGTIVHVRFKGGAIRTLTVPPPIHMAEQRRTKPEIVAEMDRLLDHCSAPEVAAALNKNGWKSSSGQAFDAVMVRQISVTHHLADRKQRLRAQGLISAREVAAMIEIHPNEIKRWRQQGILTGTRLNEKNEYFYERPEADTIQRIRTSNKSTPKDE